MDISPIATEYGRMISKDLNVPIEYVCGNLFKCIDKYDLVLSLGVIEHFSSQQMGEFVEKCIELSNKYILIAIPNQESEFSKIMFLGQIKIVKNMRKNIISLIMKI